MKLVVGLGNPGKNYEKNRHNVGFMLVNKIGHFFEDGRWVMEKRWEAEVMRVGEMILIKPTTFMNDSGRAVRKVKDYFKIKDDDVWVAHDDLDIVLGEYKIQKGKGPKIHNGLKSVEDSLAGKDFWRVRVGVDGRGGKRRETGEEYVLKDFGKKESLLVEKVMDDLMGEMVTVLV